MIRITRLADYGIVLLTYVARQPRNIVHNVPDLAAEAHMPLPTVSKILKLLARGGLVVSHRGVKGGYTLSRRPEEISLAEIVTVLDGPIALTECSGARPGSCEYVKLCPARSNLQRINDAVLTALEKISLAEMSRPLPQDMMIFDGEKARQLRQTRNEVAGICR